jgi:hypothetical protein
MKIGLRRKRTPKKLKQRKLNSEASKDVTNWIKLKVKAHGDN